MTRDEGPRTPEGGLAGKGGGGRRCEPHGRLVGAVGTMGMVGAVGEVGGVGMVEEVGGVVVFDVK